MTTTVPNIHYIIKLYTKSDENNKTTLRSHGEGGFKRRLGIVVFSEYKMACFKVGSAIFSIDTLVHGELSLGACKDLGSVRGGARGASSPLPNCALLHLNAVSKPINLKCIDNKS